MVNIKKGRLQKAKELKDARANVLYTLIAQGRVAATLLPRLYESLHAQERYAATNRVSGLDKPEENEETIDTLHTKIKSAQSDIDAANKAQQELKEIERFYRAYKIVVNTPKIKELKSRINAAEYWVEEWKSRICALDTDDDTDIVDLDQEKEYLQYEYNRAVDTMHKLQSELNSLRNTRTM